ncbi:dehydroascorbate reductase 2, partial [Tanacetum coccineum]
MHPLALPPNSHTSAHPSDHLLRTVLIRRALMTCLESIVNLGVRLRKRLRVTSAVASFELKVRQQRSARYKISIGGQNETKEKKTLLYLTTTMEGEQGEAIMICIDTSRWMMGNNSHMFKQQADAIRLYCTQKFKSQDTVVGICGMGEKCIYHLAEPHRILSRIMNSLYKASMGGDLMLVAAVMKAHTVWFGCWDKELGNHLPKRIAVFAGGPVYEEMDEVQILGKAMKDRNVACDVISFGDPAINKQQLFKTLIDAADNNRNCNLLYVPPNFTVEDALFRSQIIQCGSAPFASPPVQQECSKQNKNALSRSQIIRSGSAPFASLSVQQESSKQNIMADAALYSVADNTDALSLSRFSI